MQGSNVSTGLTRYEKTVAFHLESNLGSLKDKVVIDIAGLPTRANQHLLAAGCAEIHGVNLVPCAPHDVKGYHHHVADARSLPATIPMADAITAYSALEHLSEPDQCIRSALSRLKPGGILVMHGGPIWTSALGHHLVTHAGNREFHFGKDTDPIPPWGHLYLDRAAMSDLLIERSLSEECVSAIIFDIFDSPTKNRLAGTQIKAAFYSHRQQLVGFTEYQWKLPDTVVFERIARTHHNYSIDDLLMSELIGIIRKF